MQIKKMVLNNFKGFKEKVVEFTGNTIISADNGVGKSTLAIGYYWLLGDRDYDLQSNPKVRREVDGVPVDDVDVSVEITVDIDGTEHTLKKIQKCRKSKPDDRGQVKTTTTNSYEVNAVPLNERDFTAKLLELGIDLSKVLECTHPDVFVGNKVADMRKKLFAMAKDHSDLDLAKMNKDTIDLANLLEKYKLNEIEAMNKATIKKCKEDIESIPSKIEGMETSKKDIDVAEWELFKSSLELQSKKLDEREANNSKIYQGYSDIQNEIFKLEGFERNDIIRRANELVVNDKRNAADAVRMITDSLNALQADETRISRAIAETENRIVSIGKEKAGFVVQYRAEQAKQFPEEQWVFNEASLNCPMCGQALPADKQTEKKANFEQRKSEAIQKFMSSKKETLDYITAQGMARKTEIEKLTADVEAKKTELQSIVEKKNVAIKTLDEKKAVLAKLPSEADLKDNAELKALEAKISELKDKLDKMPSGEEIKAEIKAERIRIAEETVLVTEAFTQYKRNGEIEDMIEDLKSQRMDYEQKKADAERIMNQIKMLSKRKNELIVEEINSYFNIVKWKLFDYQANGEYIDCCVPLIDGRDFTYSANGARKILAKLEICSAFQKFYGMNMPVFLDEANEINTYNLPKFDFQLIQLRVNDSKELIIESEEAICQERNK